MVDLVRINRKVINDPLYTPVNKFLKERIRTLEEDGNRPEELALAHERYDGLKAGDLVIENPVKFPDGVTRVCFVSRKTGFARVDVDVNRVDVKDIVEDFSIPLTVAQRPSDIKNIVKKNDGKSELLWLEYKQTFGVLLSQDQAKTIDGPMEAFGNLFFENYGIHRETLTTIDLETLESGTVTISDDSCDDGVFPLFIKELVLEEMSYPEITSNLPTSLTLALGQKEVIDSRYFINLTDDITKDVNVKVTTKSGYEVGRSTEENGKLTIDVIQADPNNEIKDTMFVRVDYLYQGHPLHSIFEIAITIEKLIVGDLVMVSEPSEIETIAGSMVKVNITPFYKDVVVEIPDVPLVIKSNDGLTVLSFDTINKDGSITYSGIVNANFPSEVDEAVGVITQVFQYQSVEGLAHIKLKTIRPGVVPELVLNNHTESFEGKLGDTGVIEAELSYDGKVLDNKDVVFSLASSSESNSVIKLTNKVPEGVGFEVVKQAPVPGDILSTNVLMLANWLGPDRIWRSVTFPVGFIIHRDSEVVINLTKETPIEISKYEFDTIPLQVILNNKDITSKVDITIVPNDKNYIVITNQNAKTVQCLGTGKIAVNTELVYTFTLMVDGVEQTFTQPVQYKIAAWKGDNVVIIPSNFEITGRSDSTQSVSFTVYDDRDIISSTAVFLKDRSVLPENIAIVGEPVYNKAADNLTITFSKLDHSEDIGLICFGKQGDETLEDINIGKLNLTSNVEHSRNLQLGSKVDGKSFVVGSQGDADFELTFAGKPILLSDPNLSWERVGGEYSNTTVLLVKDNKITVNNNAYIKTSGSNNDSVTLQFKYKDDYDKQDKLLNVSFSFVIEYPTIEVSIDPAAFNCRMWDKGSLNIQAKSSIRNFSGTISNIEDTSKSKYVSLSGKNWSIIDADKESVIKTINVKFSYRLDNDNLIYSTIPVAFTIAEWDGRTFEITPNPVSIKHVSGEEGELRFTALYKFDDVTETLEVNKGSSTIPSYLLLGQPRVDLSVEPVEYVIPYTTRRGGTEDIVLNMSIFDTLHNDGRQTKNVTIKGDITWADGLNVVQMGPGTTGVGETVPNDEKNPGNITGFYMDDINYPLVMNFSGIALPNNAENVEITLEANESDVITIADKKAKTLDLILQKGGDQATDYNYTSSLKVKYVSEGKNYEVIGEPNITIRVPDVRVGYNPTHTVKLYDHGSFVVRLQQESKDGWIDCPITSLTPVLESHPLIEIRDNGWYIYSKPSINTDVTYPVVVGYSVGGKDYEKEVEIVFNVSSVNVPAFKAVLNPKVTSIKGESGTTGKLTFECVYKGYPIKTGVAINKEESIIPANLSIGELDGELNLPYQLVGAGNENAKLVVQYLPDTSPGVIGVNRDQVLLTVETTSSNEQFKVESFGESVSGHWTTTVEVPVSLKYGDKKILANAPGVTYTVLDKDNTPVTLAGINSTSIFLKLNATDGPSSTFTGKASIKVEYNDGIPDPDNVKEVDVVIVTNEALVTNISNYPVSIWQKGTFKETVVIDEALKIAVPVKKVTFQEGFTSDKIEIVGARLWEVIGAEPTTKDFIIPLVAHFVLNGKEYTVDYKTTFTIAGSVAPKYEVTPDKEVIATTLGRSETINYRITYKGETVNEPAMFKQDSSVLPEGLEVTSVVSIPNGLAITYTGIKAGVSKATIVFESVDGTETASVEHDVQVRGDFDLQVGDREVTRILTSHNFTGFYDLELTSGGIPINVGEEVANGSLTFMIASKTKSPAVLGITGWGDKGFNFKTSGVIRPGKSTELSNYITFKYKLPGTDTASLEVEIPLTYKNNAVTLTGQGAFRSNPIKARIKDKGSLDIKYFCEGIDITTSVVAVRNMTTVEYIKYNQDNTWEVVNAPEDESVASDVNTAFSGSINDIAWSQEEFIYFLVAATAEVRFVPHSNLSYDMKMGDRAGLSFNYMFDDKQGEIKPGFDYLDKTRSDMKGLISLTWNRNGEWQNQNSAIYQMETLSPTEGIEDISLCWIHQNSKFPGVKGVDFGYTTVKMNIAPRIMTVTATAITGGNGETKTSSVDIKIEGMSNSIPPNSDNVVIKSLKEDMLKVKSLSGAYVLFEITADVSKNNATYKVPIEVTWANPANKEVVVGTTDVTLNLIKPQDYPVVTNSYPESFLARLWDSGGMELFKVTIPSTKTDVTAQSDIIGGTDEGFFEYTRDIPEPGNRWWFISTGTIPGEFDRAMSFIVKAPFRDGFVEIPAYKKFDYTQSLEWQKPFKVAQSPNTTNKLPIIVGKETEIVFKPFWRNRPRESGLVDSLSVVVGEENKAIADYFDIMSEDYDSVSNEYKLTLKCKAVFDGFIDFAIGATDVAIEEMELDKNYALSRVNFATIDITLLNQETPWVINLRRANTELFKVTQSKNDYTANTTLVDVVSVDNIFTKGEGYVVPISDKPMEETTGTMQLVLRLPNTFREKLITVDYNYVIPKYDGIDFVTKLVDSKGAVFVNDPANPIKIVLNGVAEFYTLNTYAGKPIAKLATSTSERIKAANPELSLNPLTSLYVGDLLHTRVAVYQTYRGPLTIPVTYTGPTGTPVEGDVEGKNINTIQVHVWAADKALRFFPDNVEPKAVRGKYQDEVLIPCEFSWEHLEGIKANDPNIKPTLTGVGKDLFSFNRVTDEGIVINIDYRNGSDVAYAKKLDITWTYTSGNSTYTRSYSQQIDIVADNTGYDIKVVNQIKPTLNVWETVDTPFEISVDGKIIDKKNYYSVEVTKNKYVERSDLWDANNKWYNSLKVIGGDTTKKLENIPVVYDIRFSDGVAVLEKTVTVNIDINQYDGRELIVKWLNPNTAFHNAFTTPMTSPTPGLLRFEVMFQGNLVADDASYLVWASKSNMPGYTFPAVSNTNKGNGVFEVLLNHSDTDMLNIENGVLCFGKSGVATGNYVENVNHVLVPIPCYTYNPNKWYLRHDVENTTEVSGSYDGTSAPNVRVNYGVRKGIVNENVTANPKVKTKLNDAGDWIGTLDSAPNSGYGFIKFWFKTEYSLGKELTRDVTFSYGDGSTDLMAKQVVKVTQISNLDFPTVVDNNLLTVELNQKGGLPFRLTDDLGNDITDQAKLVDISSNEYIGLESNNWYVLNARTGDTTLVVEMTYETTYKDQIVRVAVPVDVLIKGYNGQPEFTDVETVKGKVWDKGTKLPFVIKINGEEILPLWISKVALVTDPVDYVTAGPSTNKPWQIVKGNTEETSVKGTYTVTINNGSRNWTITQIVTFIIEPWDGSDFRVEANNNAGFNKALNVGFLLGNNDTANAQRFPLMGFWKGERINPLWHQQFKPVLPVEGVGIHGDNPVVDGDEFVIYNIYGKTPSNSNGEIGAVAGTLRREIDSPIEEGVTTKQYSYDVIVGQPGQLHFIPNQSETNIVGYMDDTVELDIMVLLTGNDAQELTRIDFTDPDVRVTVSNPYAIKLADDGIKQNTIGFQFIKEYGYQREDEALLTIVSGSLRVWINLKITQMTKVVKKHTTSYSGIDAKMWDTGSNLPFQIKDLSGKDITSKLTNVKVLPNRNITTGVNGNVWLVNSASETETLKVTTGFEFTVNLDDGTSYPSYDESTFTIVPGFIPMIEILNHPTNMAITKGKIEEYIVKVNYMGKPGGDFLELKLNNWLKDYATIAYQDISADKTTLTIGLQGLVSAAYIQNENRVFAYGTKPAAMLQGSANITAITWVLDNKLSIYDPGYSIEGKVNSLQTFIKPGILLNGGRVVPWTSPDIETIIEPGDVGIPENAVVAIQLIIPTEAGMLFKLLPVTGSTQNNSYTNKLTYKLKSEPTKVKNMGNVYIKQLPGIEPTWKINVLEPLDPAKTQDFKFTLISDNGGEELKNGKFTYLTYAKSPTSGDALIEGPTKETIKWEVDHYTCTVKTGYKGDGFNISGIVDGNKYIENTFVPVPKSPIIMNPNKGTLTANSSTSRGLVLTQEREDGYIHQYSSGTFSNPQSKLGLAEFRLVGKWQANNTYTIAMGSENTMGKDILSVDFVPPGEPKVTLYYDIEVTPPYTITPAETAVSIGQQGGIEGLPFIIKYKDSFVTGTVTNVKVIPNEYVTVGDDGKIWKIIKADKDAARIRTHFTFDIKLDNNTYHGIGEGDFVIAAWDGKSFELVEQPEVIYLTNDKNESFDVKVNYMGSPGADKVELVSIAVMGTDYTIVSQTPSEDNTTLTIVLSAKAEASTRAFINSDIVYKTNSKAILQSQETYKTIVSSNKDALVLYNLGQRFDGAQNQVVRSNSLGRLQNGPRVIRWDDPDVVVTVKPGIYSTPASRAVVLEYAGGVVTSTDIKSEGSPLFKILSRDKTDFNNLMDISLKSEPTKIIKNFTMWCQPTGVSISASTLSVMEPLLPNAVQTLKFKLSSPGDGSIWTYVKSSNIPTGSSALLNTILPNDIKRVGDHYEVEIETGWTGTGFTIAGAVGQVYWVDQSTIQVPAAGLTTSVELVQQTGNDIKVALTITQSRRGENIQLTSGLVGNLVSTKGIVTPKLGDGWVNGKYVLTLTKSDKVGVDSITYSLVDGVYTYAGTFDYEVKPLYRTEPSPLDVDVFSTGSPLPFMVFGQDDLPMSTIEPKVIPNENVIAGKDGNVWEIIGGPLEGGDVEAEFTFKLLINGETIDAKALGVFRIQPWDGVTLDITPIYHDENNYIPLTIGREETIKVRAMYRGAPAANSVVLESINKNGTPITFTTYETLVSEDNTELTIKLAVIEGNQFMNADTNFIYSLKPEVGGSKETVVCKANCQRNALFIGDLGQNFNGRNNAVVGSDVDGILMDGGRYVPWNSEDIDCVVEQGVSYTADSREICFQYAGGKWDKNTKKGSPVFRIIGTAGGTKGYQNYMTFRLLSDSTKVTTKFSAWCIVDTGSNGTWTVKALNTLIPNTEQVLQFKLEGKGFIGESDKPIIYVKTTNNPATGRALMKPLKPSDITLEGTTYSANVHTGWTGTSFSLVGNSGNTYIEQSVISSPAATVTPTIVDNNISAELDAETIVEFTLSQERAGLKVHEFGDAATITGLTIQSGPAKTNGNGTKDGKVFKLPLLGTGEEGAVRARVFVSYQDVSYTVTLNLVAVKSAPALSLSEGFQTTGEGDKSNSLTLNQSLDLG